MPDDLTACRPTIFLAVPRVWEKSHHAIEAEIAVKPGPVRRLIERYVALGHEVVMAHRQDTEANPAARMAFRGLDRTIGNRLRANIGLDQARFVVSSAAPIHPDLVTWFHRDELTPTLKVKRQTVIERNAELIDEMYVEI